jgi:hypothetical protein
MQHARTLGLCLMAMFVFTALAASTASARSPLPEWGKCEAVEPGQEGRYANAGCTVPVKKVNHAYPGGYEWYSLDNGESRADESLLAYSRHYAQPTPTVTITVGNELKITCRQGNEDAEGAQDEFYLGGSGGRAVGTPYLEFKTCSDNQPGEQKQCHTTDASEDGQIGNETAFIDWYEKEPGAWLGSMAFLEGKNTFAPKVALEWKTEEPREHFFQQLVCINDYTISIGGGARKEALAAEVTPVNQMSPSFTTKLSPTLPTVKGTRPLEAKVNVNETWEPITIEATMVFTEVYPAYGNVNNDKQELELKATA